VTTMPEPLNVHRVVGSRYPTDVMVAGKQHMQRLVADLIRLYGAAGRARAWPAAASEG